MLLFRSVNPFGRAESLSSLALHAVARLRGRIRFLDRHRYRVSVLIERRA